MKAGLGMAPLTARRVSSFTSRSPKAVPSALVWSGPTRRSLRRSRASRSACRRRCGRVACTWTQTSNTFTYENKANAQNDSGLPCTLGTWSAFYAGLADTRGGDRLVYALIGLLTVDRLERALDVPNDRRDLNAHTRRVLSSSADDVVVYGIPGASGRLRR